MTSLTISTPSSPTHSPTLVPSSTQLVHDDDPLEDFFQHSIVDFLRLLWRCVSMFLDGRRSIDLRRPILLSYLTNIKNIGGSEQIALYRLRLTVLHEQVWALDTLRRAYGTAIIEIEVTRHRAEMIAWQEEFRR